MILQIVDLLVKRQPHLFSSAQTEHFAPPAGKNKSFKNLFVQSIIHTWSKASYFYNPSTLTSAKEAMHPVI